jgi:hypothetical protein
MVRRSRLDADGRNGSSIIADFGLASVPWVVSRALVLAALAASRHLTDHLGVTNRPIALRQGLLGWDAAFYGDIARGGYAAVSHGVVKNEGLRFFPLLPLAGRAVGLLPFVDARGGVVVVANLSALVGAALLIRLVTFETGDRALAQRSAAVLLLAPHAFVFVMGYADSLMFALAIAFFLCLRRQHWWWAVVVGVAAGLCRPVGVILVLPALVEAAQLLRRERRFRLAPFVATLAPLAGLAAYLLWARNRTGDLFLVLRLQNSRNLRGGTVSPFTSVGHAFHELFSGDRIGYGLHAITAVVIVVLVLVVARRLPLSYTVYSAASVLVALCARNLDSIERYSLATFPLVIGAAMLLRRPTWERTAMLLLAGGLVAAAMLAFTGALVP